MNLIDEILSMDVFKEMPPVLFDIGASGELNPQWKKIAKYSICVAFDADDREVNFIEKTSADYKKLLLINRIVSAEDKGYSKFYLTESPFCSSALPPNINALKPWYFQRLFKVNKQVELKSITLNEVLDELKLNRIDWFKTDSQGTDLRLYESLRKTVKDKILTAEFEPGILNSYIGEDKLHKIIALMDNENFWMSYLNIKGTQRIAPDLMDEFFTKKQQKNLTYSLRISPGWGEVTFSNTFHGDYFAMRDYLLGYVFAIVQNQHGFALEIANKGYNFSNDKIFLRLQAYAVKKIKSNSKKWFINYLVEGLYKRYLKYKY